MKLIVGGEKQKIKLLGSDSIYMPKNECQGIVLHQLVKNPDFLEGDKYYVYNSDSMKSMCDFSDGKLHIVKNKPESGGIYLYMGQSHFYCPKDHKVIHRFRARSSTGSQFRGFYNGTSKPTYWGSQFIKTLTSSNVNYSVKFNGVTSTSYTRTIYYPIDFGVHYTTAQAKDVDIEIEYINCFDLTADFGEGNEPTIEEFNNLLKPGCYPYGEILI